VTRLQACALTACGALWLAGVGAGTKLLWDFQTTPGAPGSPPRRWPAASRIERQPGRSTLLLMAHPQCPCTRASVAELASLVGRIGERTAVHVLVFKPRDFPPDWERSDIWSSAARIPGVRVQADDDGEEAARFGAATSGQVLLYDAGGRLQFSGGITNARGHRGESAGFERIVALANGGVADAATSRVFGCALAGATE
jgi:hypothetical protein